MTDLDIQTAQLIIQLARDDLYQLDDDNLNQNNGMSDLEFALAEQEREFMQYWTDYGDAQMNNPITGNGRNADVFQGGANANFGASSTNTSTTTTTTTVPRPHDTTTPGTGTSLGLAQATQATPPRFREPARVMFVPVQQVDDDDDDDNDGGPYINPYEPTPGASSSRAAAVTNVLPTPSLPVQHAYDFDDLYFRSPIPVQASASTSSTSSTASASGSEGFGIAAVQEQESGGAYDDLFELYHRHLQVAAEEDTFGDEPEDEDDMAPHLISFDDSNPHVVFAPMPSPPRPLAVQVATEDEDDGPRLISLPGPPIPSPPLLVSLRVVPDDESSDDEDASSVYVYDPFLDPRVECHFCKEQCPMSTTINTPCDHRLCQACITRLIELCTKDETAYPPKCCDNKLLTDHIQSVAIDANLQRRYESKVHEYETPIRIRVYCHRCGDFLDSSSSTIMTGASTSTGTVIHSSKYCGTCFVRTCTNCKQATHPMRPCQDTPEELALKNLAKVKGWQTCPDCKTVVELKAGCYHMTCRCTAQFCYLCAVKWKACNCPAFEEERLLAMAA